MAKPGIILDLTKAITALEGARPYSTSPDAKAWRDALTRLKTIEAILVTMDAFRPGVLKTLESAALDELQVAHADPIQAVSDLVDRYCKRRERLR